MPSKRPFRVTRDVPGGINPGSFGRKAGLGAAGADRPSGVAAPNWIPINDKLGFVVMPLDTSDKVASPDKQPLLLTPAASGYFMARSSIGWQRLVIVEPLKGPGATG